MAEIPPFAGMVVRCLDISHEPKSAIVAFMVRKSETGHWRPRADNLGEQHVILDRHDRIDDSVVTGMFAEKGLLEVSGHREHVQMTCPLCGVNLSARSERLDAILDDIWVRGELAGLVESRPGGGVLGVPLSVLAANL